MSRAEGSISWAVLAFVVLGATTFSGQRPKPERAPLPSLVPAEPAWTVSLDVEPAAPGAIDRDHVYVPLKSGTIAALARDDGRVVWSADVVTRLAPVAAGETVYVMTSNGAVALDPVTGMERWRASTESPLAIAPTLVADRLLVCVSPSRLVALAAHDGRVVWERVLPSPPTHRPVGTADRIFVALTDGSVVALNAADGNETWRRTLPPGLAQPTLAGDRLIVGSESNEVFALNAGNGALAWRWRVGGDVIGAAATDEVVFITALDNVLRTVNRRSGNQRWKKAIASRPAHPPATTGDLVVVTSTTPTISVYDQLDGTLVGSYQAPGELEGPALLPPLGLSTVGMVVITRDGRVVGLRSKPEPPAPPPAPAGRGRGAPPADAQPAAPTPPTAPLLPIGPNGLPTLTPAPR